MAILSGLEPDLEGYTVTELSALEGNSSPTPQPNPKELGHLAQQAHFYFQIGKETKAAVIAHKVVKGSITRDALQLLEDKVGHQKATQEKESIIHSLCEDGTSTEHLHTRGSNPDP